MQRSQFKRLLLNFLRVHLKEKFKNILLNVFYATGPTTTDKADRPWVDLRP